MILKRILCPGRVRKPPAGFNWLDHRLVRNGYLDRCSHQAAALYLFLVTVADIQGLSYYSDATLMKRLSMNSTTLAKARRNLVRIGLIAYKKPLCQVLSLDGNPVPAAKTTVRKPSFRTNRKPSDRGGIQSLSEILTTIMEEKA